MVVDIRGGDFGIFPLAKQTLNGPGCSVNERFLFALLI